MEAQVQGQVLGVSGRQSKNGQHTMYDVALSDGNKYTTFDADLAGRANALTGQQVTANVSVEQNGKWTNYNISEIQAAVGVPVTSPVALPTAIPTAIPVGTATPATGIPIQTPSPGGGGMSNEDKARISRLSAVSTAFAFVGSIFEGAGPEALGEALGMARGLTEGILQYGVQGVWPTSVPATPAGIATTVPGVQVGVEGVQTPATDDIPWDAPVPVPA